ncbi:MAG: RNA methyltransferase, partial [Candidatus Marinimicrobia bacterium]|nr:RNA methyltransferase [Candidatus Neomarinimicrobiota bacterium]
GLGMLKSSHVEEVLNSCIQLGLTELVPLNSSRSEKKSLNRTRLEKIAIAAMKQCGRSRLTKISDPTGLTQFVSDSSGDDLKLIGVMDRRLPSLNTLLNGLNGVLVKNVSALIGPEGDFTEDEIETALNSGFKAVSLGVRRLRSETASTVIVSQVMAHCDGRTAE